MKLEVGEFLTELNKLYESSQGKVRLSFKKYLGEEVARKKRKAVSAAAQEAFCLVRAVTKDRKISTDVSAQNCNEFQNKVSGIVRGVLNSRLAKVETQQ